VEIALALELSISPLSREDYRGASDLLGQAFGSDPNALAIWRKTGKKEQRKEGSLIYHFRLGHGDSIVLGARMADKLVGVLNMVRSPTCQMERRELLSKLPLTIGIVGTSVFHGALGRMANMSRAWSERDPQELHWHVGPIGVLPELQGKGIGSKLIEKCIGIIDQDGMGAYLETSNPANPPLYRRFGFSVTDEASVNSVPNYFMWRPAAR
jgi:ribosomal protein S18 acetylase RimI-like enzyme